MRRRKRENMTSRKKEIELEKEGGRTLRATIVISARQKRKRRENKKGRMGRRKGKSMSSKRKEE